MRTHPALWTGLAVLIMALPSQASAMAHLRASIDGASENPPSGSPGTGVGQFLIDTATNTLFYHISYTGLVGAETAAHIHGFAPPDSNAGVKHGLPAGNPKIGTWAYAESDEAGILAGRTYVNIHSTASPGGEIRGQIVVEPSTDLVALIDPLQEVPPNPPSTIGIGVFSIDTAANILSFDIRYGTMTGTETAAHIHGPAPAGMIGGVLHTMPTGNPKIGTWNYPENRENDILTANTYVNIHSTFDAGGEIRGQIGLTSPTVGVEEVAVSIGGQKLLAAPNPVSGGGNVALFYRLPEAGHLQVTIYDASGRVIRRVHDAPAQASGILTWDTRDSTGAPVAAGVYFARLESAGSRQTQRIVVLR